MDDISFDPNLIDCFLNGEGDYDFLHSMLGNLTEDEIGTLVQKIGDILSPYAKDADLMPKQTLKRTLQILYVTRQVDIPFTWEQYQAILEPFLDICASIRNTRMLKIVYVALNEHLLHPTFLKVAVTASALRPAISQMGKQLLTVGDYECEAVVFETMIRLSYMNRQEWTLMWFTDEQHINWFNNYRTGEFEKTCRAFLNILNNSMDDQQKVFSYVAKCAFIDGVEMVQPLQVEFWVDFNYGSSSISFYCTEQEPDSDAGENSSSWDTIIVTYDNTLSCHLQQLPVHGLQEVIAYLRGPCCGSQIGSTSPSTSTEDLEKPSHVKIVFDDTVELWYHLECIFKSLYKGLSTDVDGDVPYHLMNGSNKNNQELAGNSDIEQDAPLFASRGGRTSDLDSDNELQIDEQFPTSTPISYAGQVQFQSIPHLQLTPLSTMGTQRNGMNSRASDRQFSQNSSFNEDASGSNTPESSDFSSQPDFPLIGNVFSQNFTHSQLLASLGKEKQRKDSSCSGDAGSTEQMLLLSQIKKEVISSSENSLLEGLESQPDYNVKKESSENLEDFPFYDQTSAEKNDENEEEEEAVVPSQATEAKESSVLLDSSILVEKKKTRVPKPKTVRQKPGFKPTVSSAILTSVRKAATSTKRKRSVAWSDLQLPEENQQKDEVSASADLVDNSKTSNSSNASLKTISGNTKKDLGSKKKSTNKARGGRKIQQVDKDDVSTPIQEATTSGASPPVETAEPIGETPRRRSILKKTAPTQNTSSKASSQGKKQASSNTASSMVKSAVTIPLRDVKMMTKVVELVESRRASLLQKKNQNHGVEVQLSKLAEITVTPHVHEETEVTPSSPEPNPPLPEDQNGDDAAASPNPLDFSDPTPLSSNKNTADDGKVHFGSSKPATKTGRKRTTLFNVSSEKRADFSPVEIDETAALDQHSHGKSNAKGAKNALSKKSRQPSAKAKKLLSTSLVSRPVDDTPSFSSLNDKEKENGLSPSEEYGSDDYGLFVTPIAVSKSKTRRSSFKTPERKNHSKDSGFETEEKGALTATPGSLDVLHKKEKKISADDKVQENTATEVNPEMPELTPMDDSDDHLRDPRLAKKKKVSKVNRKAAVSSMKKTKQILQPVVNEEHAGESDYPSVMELKPDESSASKGSKLQNAAINMEVMEDSDSDPSWFSGDKPRMFETPAKTYNSWKSKCEERFKTEPKKKSRKTKAKISVQSKEWLDIEEFHLEVESTQTQKSRVSHSESLKSLITKTVTAAKAKSDGTSKSVQSSSNARKGKKTTKLTLPTLMPAKIQKRTLMSSSARLDPAEGSTSPTQLGVPEDDVPFTEEPEIMDNEETYLLNTVNVSLPLMNALSERKKSFETSTKERFSKLFQNKRQATNSHKNNLALSKIPERVSPSSPSSDSSMDFTHDPKVQVPVTLNEDSDSSSEGSIMGPESTADHALDFLAGYRNTLKRMHSPTSSKAPSRMPPERTSVLENFLSDAISNSSTSANMRQRKEKLAKNRLLAKRDFNAPGPSRNSDSPAGMSTSGNPGSFMDEEHSPISGLHFANMLDSSESSSFSSDESLSPIDESATLASNFEKEWSILQKFTNTAQIVTSNVYQTMISLQEDHVKMLNDFQNEGRRMVLEPSTLRDFQRKKVKYLQKTGNRLRKLGDMIKVYRSKEKRFNKAFMFMKHSNFKAYAKKRSQAKKMAPHSQKKQMFKDLRKIMYETSPRRYLSGHR